MFLSWKSQWILALTYFRLNTSEQKSNYINWLFSSHLAFSYLYTRKTYTTIQVWPNQFSDPNVKWQYEWGLVYTSASSIDVNVQSSWLKFCQSHQVPLIKKMKASPNSGNFVFFFSNNFYSKMLDANIRKKYVALFTFRNCRFKKSVT